MNTNIGEPQIVNRRPYAAAGREEFMLRTAEYLIETADRCIRLANIGRNVVAELGDQAKTTEARSDLAAASRHVADELEAIGQEMLTKAVEIDTQRQKSIPGTLGA